MKKLTEREDQIMQLIWPAEGVFIRDIVEALPNPKPHYNTIATMVKILVKKGFLKSEILGNSHRYSPAVEMEEYRNLYITNIKKKYFGNSLPRMIAHFAKEENLSEEEVEEIVRLIKSDKS